MKIRTATMDDLNEIANVEAECFPAAKAATKEEFADRIRYYAKFGFVDEGVSDKSSHGNVVWHQMRLTF